LLIFREKENLGCDLQSGARRRLLGIGFDAADDAGSGFETVARHVHEVTTVLEDMIRQMLLLLLQIS
jgi:hypothetical protein